MDNNLSRLRNDARATSRYPQPHGPVEADIASTPYDKGLS